MIAGPANQGEFEWCRAFLADRNINVSPQAHIITWLRDGKPTWVVALDDWMGSSCMMYMASSQAYPPRRMIQGVFNYAFNIIKRKVVFALVRSDLSALRLDKWLGFREVYRADKCAENGSDIVFLVMEATEWEKHGQKIRTAAA